MMFGIVCGMSRISFTTSLWPQNEASFGTTVPREILAIRGIDPDSETSVNWSINEETGAIEVSFEEDNDGGD